jgi:molecular chaperone GrpE
MMAVNPAVGNDEPLEGNTEDALDAAMADVAGLDAVAEATSDSAAELAAEKNRSLRLQAEMENLRARTAREIAEQAHYATLPLMRDLLPVVDNIDRALDAASQAGDADSLLEGIRMVQQQLLSALAQHNCVRIEALGKPFDPQFHAAIMQQPSDEVPANHVLLVAQAGYKLHDRVVRPAQVIISTGPAAG